ncbi:MAG TPA: hypothetical protein VIK72_00875 [Clostridiaceae bacterium]
MNEEISRVLKLIEEGKIDAEKGAELIEALNKSKGAPQKDLSTNKMLKIKVNTQAGDDVNINIPVNFIKAVGGAIKKIPKIAGIEGLEEIDVQAIMTAISEGLDGKIMDVKSANGDIVEMVVE